MTTQQEPVTKLPSGGFSQDCEWMTLTWDEKGKYKGQWQPDMIGDCDQTFFIGPDPSGRCFVPDLTQEQMEKAR